MTLSVTFSGARIDLESEDAALLAEVSNYFEAGGGVQNTANAPLLLRVLLHAAGDFGPLEKGLLSGAEPLPPAPLLINRREYLSGGNLLFFYPDEQGLCLFD